MTDQADTPDPIGAIRARWSRNGGMGNDRSDEDYTDAGCRILARAAFRDFATLDLAMRAMRAEIARLTAELAAARAENERLTRRLWPSQGEGYANEVERQRAVIDMMAESLAAARDREAALRSALERTQANFIDAVRGNPVRGMAENLAENAAALGASVQSGQPTKGASE